MGAPKDMSFLPEDVEQKLRDIENHIVSLNKQKADLDDAVSQKKADLASVCKDIDNANIELVRVTGLSEGKIAEMNARELNLNQRESNVETWANDLGKKEKQINRYLAIFENMKNVIN